MSYLPRLERLTQWLLAHACADAVEQRHRARMLELLASSRSDPCAADHFAPGHFTASAFVLSARGDQLLLIHHRKLKRWLQPGGHVEAVDGDLLTTARREAHEETGLGELDLVHEGPFDLDVHDIPAFGAQPAHAHFDMRFLFRARESMMTHTAAPGQEPAPSWNLAEVNAARFFPLRDLLRLADEPGADASVMRAVRKLEG